jgi:hypothetical protein
VDDPDIREITRSKYNGLRQRETLRPTVLWNATTITPYTEFVTFRKMGGLTVVYNRVGNRHGAAVNTFALKKQKLKL